MLRIYSTVKVCTKSLKHSYNCLPNAYILIMKEQLMLKLKTKQKGLHEWHWCHATKLKINKKRPLLFSQN